MTCARVRRARHANRASPFSENQIFLSGTDRDPLRPGRPSSILRVGHESAWVRWITMPMVSLLSVNQSFPPADVISAG